MSALELAAEIAADLRNRERRFALGYTDHGLTRAQIAAYYRRRARWWRRLAEDYRTKFNDRAAHEDTHYDRIARQCDRRAKDYEK